MMTLQLGTLAHLWDRRAARARALGDGDVTVGVAPSLELGKHARFSLDLRTRF